MDRIVEELRPSRNDRGLTPHCTAAAGFHQSTISTAERTERIPGIDVLPAEGDAERRRGVLGAVGGE